MGITPYTGLGGDYLLTFGGGLPEYWTEETFTYDGDERSWLEWASIFEGYNTPRLSFNFLGGTGGGSLLDTDKLDEVLTLFDSVDKKPILLMQNRNEPYPLNWVFTQGYQDYWTDLTTTFLNDARIAAFSLWGEMNPYDYGAGEYVAADVTQRFADIIDAIHVIDPDRVCIFPLGQLYYDNAADWITDIATAGFTAEPFVVFDIVHPYYFENAYDMGLTVTEKVAWYVANWITPCVAAFGAADCYAGETFAWTGPEYTPYLQHRWLVEIINAYATAGISFNLWVSLFHTQLPVVIPAMQESDYPGLSDPEPTGVTLPWDDQLDVINDWTEHTGTWGVAANVLTGTYTDVALISVGEGEWTNYYMQATLEITAAAVYHEAALIVRFADTSNYYWGGLGCFGHEYSIAKYVSGIYTEIASSGVVASVAHATPYTVKFVVNGTTLQLWVGGVKRLEVTDSSLTSGAMGVRGWNTELEVTSPSAASTAISTFGDTTLEAGASAIATAGICNIQGAVYTLGEAGYATSISVPLSRVVAGSDNVKCAIYLHSDLSLVAETPAISTALTTNDKWFNYPFTTPVSLAADDYVLVCEAEYTAQNISMYKVAGAVNQEHYEDLVAYGAFTDPLVPVSANFEYSIYCNYTPTNPPGSISMVLAGAINNRRRG